MKTIYKIYYMAIMLGLMTACGSSVTETVVISDPEVAWEIQQELDLDSDEKTNQKFDGISSLTIDCNSKTSLKDLEKLKNLSDLTLNNPTALQLDQISELNIFSLTIVSDLEMVVPDTALFKSCNVLKLRAPSVSFDIGEQALSCKELYLYDSLVINGLEMLKSQTQLETLVINPIGEIDSSLLVNMSKLKVLYLSNGQLNNAQLLGKLTQLEELGLVSVLMDNDTWVEKLKNVKYTFIK